MDWKDSLLLLQFESRGLPPQEHHRLRWAAARRCLDAIEAPASFFGPAYSALAELEETHHPDEEVLVGFMKRARRSAQSAEFWAFGYGRGLVAAVSSISWITGGDDDDTSEEEATAWALACARDACLWAHWGSSRDGEPALLAEVEAQNLALRLAARSYRREG